MATVRKDKKMDTIRKKMDSYTEGQDGHYTEGQDGHCTEGQEGHYTEEEEETSDGFAGSDTGLRRRCKQVLVCVTHSDINVNRLTSP